MINIDDYRNAPGGTGPQALDWEDKPHRLVYDLCNEVDRQAARIEELTADRETLLMAVQWFADEGRYDKTVTAHAKATLLSLQEKPE